jgi:hypothetical protein
MILPGTRLLLVIFSGLTLLAFIVLFVLADETERYFAWTIKPPATAAFLGGAYAAGCALELLAFRRRTWAALRIPFVTILLFTVTTLVASVLHLDRFHFGSEMPMARNAAYLWLAIYIVVPLAMIVVLVIQERRPAERIDRLALPAGLRATLVIQGGVMFAVGAALFLVPDTAAALWPWMLTPLTARIVAAWLLAFGVGVILAAAEGDLARLDIAAWAYGLLAVLELVVIIRFPATVRWSTPAIWVYLALAATILVTSAYALLRLRGRSPRARLGSGEQPAVR